MPLTLESPSFAEGKLIPIRQTCDGADLSPELVWSGTPEGAQSFVLINDDPDAPAGTWNHWLLYDIPASVDRLPEGCRVGEVGISGRNDFRRLGYGGPCPPPGHGPHRYFFRLFAVNKRSLGLQEGAVRQEIEKAFRGSVLAEAEYMGTYQRR